VWCADDKRTRRRGTTHARLRRTRGWNARRRRRAYSVRRLGSLAKGRFLDPERRSRRPRERAREIGKRERERERREEVRSRRLVKNRKTEEEEADRLSLSLSLPLDLYSIPLDGLRRRKKVKDRFSGRGGSWPRRTPPPSMKWLTRVVVLSASSSSSTRRPVARKLYLARRATAAVVVREKIDRAEDHRRGARMRSIDRQRRYQTGWERGEGRERSTTTTAAAARTDTGERNVLVNAGSWRMRHRT